jgi:hypothetical protein
MITRNCQVNFGHLERRARNRKVSVRAESQRQRRNLPKLCYLSFQLLFPRSARSAGVVSSASPVDSEGSALVYRQLLCVALQLARKLLESLFDVRFGRLRLDKRAARFLKVPPLYRRQTTTT